MESEERATRTVTWSRLAAVAIMLIGVALTFHVSWILSIMIVLLVGMFQSRQLFIGYIPVSLPSFDEQVRGLMLGGMSKEKATANVARGEAARAILLTVLSALLTALVCLVAYHVGSPESWNNWIGSFLGHAALWIVAIGILGVVLPFGTLVYALATKSIRKG